MERLGSEGLKQIFRIIELVYSAKGKDVRATHSKKQTVGSSDVQQSLGEGTACESGDESVSNHRNVRGCVGEVNQCFSMRKWELVSVINFILLILKHHCASLFPRYTI